jgi:hypothetical protein
MSHLYHLFKRKEYQSLFTGANSEERFTHSRNRKEDISYLHQVLSREEYPCLQASNHFAQIQLNPPISPIKGMDWIDIDSCAEVWGEHFQALKHLDRFTVIQMLGNFPSPLLRKPPSDKKKQEVIWVLQDFYQGIATWLFHWETEIPVPSLKTTHWADYEAFALLAEARYRLCRGIIDRDPRMKQLYNTPAFLWLMCEAAVCRQMLANYEIAFELLTSTLDETCNLQFHKDRKDRVYEGWRKYNEVLETCGILPDTRTPTSVEEWLTKLDRIIEIQAKALGENDKDFDRFYWLPYLRAKKHWGAVFRRPELQILSDKPTKKRGPSVGFRKKQTRGKKHK